MCHIVWFICLFKKILLIWSIVDFVEILHLLDDLLDLFVPPPPLPANKMLFQKMVFDDSRFKVIYYQLLFSNCNAKITKYDEQIESVLVKHAVYHL